MSLSTMKTYSGVRGRGDQVGRGASVDARLVTPEWQEAQHLRELTFQGGDARKGHEAGASTGARVSVASTQETRTAKGCAVRGRCTEDLTGWVTKY